MRSFWLLSVLCVWASALNGMEWSDLLGKAPREGVVLMPLGYHTEYSFNLSNNQIIGIVSHSLAAGSFINSYGDRSGYFVVVRDFYQHKGFGVEAFGGVVAGYKGQLADKEGVPLRNTFLFEHDINPVAAINLYYRCTQRFSLQTMITPLVIGAGFQIHFD